MQARQVTILDGSTFVVSDVQGDIDAKPDQPLGLFYRDMRHLSTWQVLLNGRSLDALSTAEFGYDEAVFFLALPTGTIYQNPQLSVVRRRFVGDGLREELTVNNSGMDDLVLELTMLFDSDFADIFEVKDHQAKAGHICRRVQGATALLRYRRADFSRETRIAAEGAFFTEASLSYRLSLAAGQTWQGVIEVSVSDESHQTLPKRRSAQSLPQPNMGYNLAEWIASAPQLECGWEDLRHVYRRSIEDLAALRFYPEVVAGSPSLPAAGLPWFMALFGRDSLITSYQALPFVPELAATTLRALASRQARGYDDFRDAEPGKILHELRFGELAYFGDRPQSPYYGSADATPLFLIVLDEYERWTGDRALVRELERPARAALAWVEKHGDLDGDGYLEYQRRNTRTGLENQCWKDSWNSVVHPDGSPTVLPRATCELQGYAYDARRRMARLARAVWGDDGLADRLEADAAELKRRFNADYWLDDERFFALARDGSHRRVRTLTSNPGHLLWSGIVDEDRVEDVSRRLMDGAFFSGWGVRTLASGQRAYNPIEYHNGTVWPHDNALIAQGLARYGKHEEAGRIAVGILEAARHFHFRLPEAFAGYDRGDTGVPVEYPTACSPQAWATGTPLLLLRTLLGMQPAQGTVTTAAHVPDRIGQIRIDRVHGPAGPVTVEGG
jgi:glycogen debranching enzyme